MKKHRNSQKRIKFQDACYFVTTKTFDNFPYFREWIFCDLFVGNLIFCKKLKGFLLYGWVLVYDHFHLLIQPNDKFDISDVMHCVKRNISRNINFVMGFNKYDHNPEGRDYNPGLQDTDDPGLRGIYEFTKILYLMKFRFQIKFFNGNPYPKFKWQDRFHDHYIRNDRDFNDKMEYIAWNPDKHGMPPDWPYVFTNPKYENLTDNIL